MYFRSKILMVPRSLVFLIKYATFAAVLTISKTFTGFINHAGVAKLADASDLGSDAARHVGSSPITRTKKS